MSKLFTFINPATGFPTEAEAYEVNDFVNVGGVANANKPPILNAQGKFDGSMFDVSQFAHGDLSGLDQDHHTQYLLVDGTRAMTGNLQLNSNEALSSAVPTTPSSLVNKAYVDAIGVGNRMKGAVKCATIGDIALTGLQVIDGYTLVAGDRILVKDQVDKTENGLYVVAAGAWTRTEDLDNAPQGEILNGVLFPRVENSASGQDTRSYYISSIGTGTDNVHIIGTDDIVIDIYTTSTQLTSGNGIIFNGNTVEVDLKDAESGLYFDGNQDLGIDWSTLYNDAKPIKAMDLSSTAVGKGADILGFADANNRTDKTTVSDVLDELYSLIAEQGVEYTVGTGGVTKGDVLFISGTDTASTYADLTQAHRALGLALETRNSGEVVKSLANDTILRNVLSGATAGQPYYWNGATFVNSIPSGSGSHVWQVGTAKNSTDLHVELRFIKVNA